ncbi:unnamed protein product [Lepeophtheirus salmonis]|uniref:(salmon louse) hypothetical protein n=1 Tax=Lepeophtheirus salmonis TaxID=72036 RepID=A0A7R8D6C0_LEPSM|nr:unnamed protein product [Lepeophtheirus salmonis]CAF3042193.1 unnamed protein product [Lepeophtheirus salmonis]
MGAKRTSDLIPLCHPIQLAHIGIELSLDSDKTAVNIVCSATCSGKTGVEMEALSGATIAALALYDMSKSVTHKIVIQDIRLLEKTGGKRNVKVHIEITRRSL